MADAGLAEAEAHLIYATVFRARTLKLRNVYAGGAVRAQGFACIRPIARSPCALRARLLADDVRRKPWARLTLDAVVPVLLHLHGDNSREPACRATKRQTREIQAHVFVESRQRPLETA